MHAALNINGFPVMFNDDFPEMTEGKSMTPTALGGTPVTIHLTVTDVDAKFQRAIDAGATVLGPARGPVLGRPLRRGPRPVRPPLVAWAAGARGRRVRDRGHHEQRRELARRASVCLPRGAVGATHPGLGDIAGSRGLGDGRVCIAGVLPSAAPVAVQPERTAHHRARRLMPTGTLPRLGCRSGGRCPLIGVDGLLPR